jgi:thioredoxin-dependent peroxiredoxin
VRDALGRINELGAEALGISPDSVEAQKKFSDELNLNFPLLSDADHSIAEAYGVWDERTLYGKKHMGITRSSFLIGANGEILGAWYDVSPDDTVPRALEVMEKDR